MKYYTYSRVVKLSNCNKQHKQDENFYFLCDVFKTK